MLYETIILTVSGTGELYHRRFKPLVENVVNEAQNVLLASSALQNGYQQSPMALHKGDQSIMNHAQPPSTPYAHTNGYNQSTYTTGAMPVTQSAQPLSAPVTSSPHPPLYPESYQHSQSNQIVASDPSYQPNSSAHHGSVYPSNSMTYQHDPQQTPHMGTQMLGVTNYVTYQQPGSNQHADALLSLTPTWDDPTALWPQSIQSYIHQQQQGHP